MTNRRIYILIVFILLIIILIFIYNFVIHKNQIDRDGKLNTSYNIIMNEETQKYIVYNKNNEEITRSFDQDELKIYEIDPDYDYNLTY